MKSHIFNILFAIVTISSNTFSECTREQAFDRMMKLNQLSVSLQNLVPLDPTVDGKSMNSAYEKMKEYRDRIAPAGPLLAEGRYNEACKIYADTAKHFGFNLETSDSITMKSLHDTSTSNSEIECDLTEMAKRNIILASDFHSAYAKGKFSYLQQRQFFKDSEELNKLATSNPDKACQEIEALRLKYGL